jgi:hypothetical protein
MATADDNRIARPSPSLYDASDLPRVRYLAAVTSRGFVHLAFDAIRGTIDAAAIRALGRGVVVHASPRERAPAAFVWLPGELPCLIEAEHGFVRIEAAGARDDGLPVRLAARRRRAAPARGRGDRVGRCARQLHGAAGPRAGPADGDP